MCGRFEQKSSLGVIAGAFRVTGASLHVTPHYNISPSRDVLLVRIGPRGSRLLATCRWGFPPPAGSGLAHPVINARAETVATRPLFREAFAARRGLVVATGFYEWRTDGKTRVPYYVHLSSGAPFGMAAVFIGAEGSCGCAVITTAANKLVGRIHHRMPAIIRREDEDLWLDPGEKDIGILLKLLKPFPPELLSLHEVSTRVNNPAYDEPDASSPLT